MFQAAGGMGMVLLALFVFGFLYGFAKNESTYQCIYHTRTACMLMGIALILFGAVHELNGINQKLESIRLGTQSQQTMQSAMDNAPLEDPLLE